MVEQGRTSLPNRHGFLWRAQFWTDHTHPQGYGYGCYYKWIRAWTYIGAMRKAERLRHRRWSCAVARWKCMPPTEFAEMPYLYLQAGYEIDLVTGEPVLG